MKLTSLSNCFVSLIWNDDFLRLVNRLLTLESRGEKNDPNGMQSELLGVLNDQFA